LIQNTPDDVPSGTAVSEDHQRIDKWLWHARVVRTRTDAAALAASGRVRRNGVRVDAASRAVKPGDVLTIALDRGVRLLRILRLAQRRGSAEAGRMLYEEMGSMAAQARASEQPQRGVMPREGR
jgi:ribosome-associated heat shock protein Hsp15